MEKKKNGRYQIGLAAMLLAAGIGIYGIHVENVTAEENAGFTAESFEDTFMSENSWESGSEPTMEDWTSGELNSPDDALSGEENESENSSSMLSEKEVKTTDFPEDASPCGELENTVFWTLNPDGELYIFGTGNMMDWEKEEDVPWASFRQEIKKVKIEEGVTSIGSYAFCDCEALTDMETPDSVLNIGMYAFYNCAGLSTVSIG